MLAEDLRMLSYLMNLTLACLTESEGNSLWEHFIWFKKNKISCFPYFELS